jgi:hypothetical protein
MTALGFGPSPRPQKIYLNRQYPDCLWYFWDHAGNKPQPIAHGSLTGYLTKIEIQTKEFRGKEEPKINLHLRCDRAYKIQIGFETLTAKSLLSALTLVEDFTKPITIAPEPGDTEQVVFGKIALDGEILYAPYAEDTDWPSILQALIDRLPPSTATSTVRAVNPAPMPSAPRSASPTPKLPTLPTVSTPQNAIKTIEKRTITEPQRMDFAALVRACGWSTEAVRSYLVSLGYAHSSVIAPHDYKSVCDGIREDEIRQHFEEKATIAADQLGTWEAA